MNFRHLWNRAAMIFASLVLCTSSVSAFWGVEQKIYYEDGSAFVLIDGGYMSLKDGKHYLSKHAEAAFARKMIFTSNSKRARCLVLDTVVDCGTEVFALDPREHLIDAATSSERVCLLAASGLHCFEQPGKAIVPPVPVDPDAKQLVSAGSTLCVLSGDYPDASTKCWNLDVLSSRYSLTYEFKVSPTPELTGVDKLYADSGIICAMTDQGLKCWGHWYSKVPIPALDRSYQHIAISDRVICAVKDRQGSCWGDLNHSPPASMLEDIEQIALGFEHWCTMGARVVRCARSAKDEVISEYARDMLKAPTRGTVHVAGDDRELFVWDADGLRVEGPYLSKELRALRVSSGATVRTHQGSNFCMLHASDKSVTCGHHQIRVLKHADSLTSDGDDYCALVKDDLHCWHWDRYGRSSFNRKDFSSFPKTIPGAKEIYLLYSGLCAKIETSAGVHEIRCFGLDKPKEGVVRQGLSNPRKMLGWHCILDENAVYCPRYGSKDPTGKIDFGISEPLTDAAELDFNQVCAFFAEAQKIVCVDQLKGTKVDRWPIHVHRPQGIIAIDSSNFCVQHPRGLECGPKIADASDRFRMGRFEHSLKSLASMTYKDRAPFFERFAQLDLTDYRLEQFAKFLLHDLVVASMPNAWRSAVSEEWLGFQRLMKLHFQIESLVDIARDEALVDLSLSIVDSIFTQLETGEDQALIDQIARVRLQLANVGGFYDRKDDLATLAKVFLEDQDFIKAIVPGNRRDLVGKIVTSILEWWRNPRV
jgi:hypothetical protein